MGKLPPAPPLPPPALDAEAVAAVVREAWNEYPALRREFPRVDALLDFAVKGLAAGRWRDRLPGGLYPRRCNSGRKVVNRLFRGLQALVDERLGYVPPPPAPAAARPAGTVGAAAVATGPDPDQAAEARRAAEELRLVFTRELPPTWRALEAAAAAFFERARPGGERPGILGILARVRHGWTNYDLVCRVWRERPATERPAGWPACYSELQRRVNAELIARLVEIYGSEIGPWSKRAGFLATIGLDA